MSKRLLHRIQSVLNSPTTDVEKKEQGRRKASQVLYHLGGESSIAVKYDEQHTIGKRYARHDEIGTPYCLTLDEQTLEDGTVTIRYRDDKRQERIAVDRATEIVQEALRTGKL